LSSGEFSCMTLKAIPNSLIVGSQTAGADGNVIRINPSQDIHSGFSSLGVYYPDGTQTQRIGIVPDVVVYPTAMGIKQGRDEILEKAFEIANCNSYKTGNEESSNAKTVLALYPNPATDNISISFSISDLSDKSISIYNSTGIKIKYFSESELFGKSTVNFSTKTLPSGVYYCIMNDGENKITKKFILMR